MNTAIEIQVRCNGDEDTRSLTEFPARIGRDDGCELHLPYPFVSRRHARIEQQGAAFFLIDEGSCNGITYQGRRVAVGERVELKDGGDFVIECLTARVRLSEETQPMQFDPNSEEATSLYAEQQVVPQILARVGAAMEEYRAARNAAVEAISVSLDALPEATRVGTAKRLAGLHPELASDAAACSLFDRFGVDVRPAPRLPPVAQVALRGLEKIAAVYVSDAAPPKDARELAAFLGCINEALTALVVAKTELDSVGRNTTCEEGAELARRLGRALLDWTAPPGEAAHRALTELRAFASEHEAVRVDLEHAIQRVAGELSPDVIDRVTRRPWWQPLSLRRRWTEFVRRHRAIAETFAERAARRTGPRTLLLPPSSPTPEEDDPAPSGGTHWPFTRAPAWE